VTGLKKQHVIAQRGIWRAPQSHPTRGAWPRGRPAASACVWRSLLRCTSSAVSVCRPGSQRKAPCVMWCALLVSLWQSCRPEVGKVHRRRGPYPRRHPRVVVADQPAPAAAAAGGNAPGRKLAARRAASHGRGLLCAAGRWVSFAPRAGCAGRSAPHRPRPSHGPAACWATQQHGACASVPLNNAQQSCRAHGPRAVLCFRMQAATEA
jgi:hypothetical protein